MFAKAPNTSKSQTFVITNLLDYKKIKTFIPLYNERTYMQLCNASIFLYHDHHLHTNEVFA